MYEYLNLNLFVACMVLFAKRILKIRGVIFWHNSYYTIHTHERETKKKEKDVEINITKLPQSMYCVTQIVSKYLFSKNYCIHM
jgi:hypothetical protein